MYTPERKAITPIIPTREKIKDETSKIYTLSSDEVNRIKESIVPAFISTFSLKENDGDKMKLAQLERFSQELQGRNYSFESNDIKAFVKEQIRREIGVNFYEEFQKKFLESSNYLFEIIINSDKDNISKDCVRALNKEIVNMLKLHMRASLGEVRIEEKLK